MATFDLSGYQEASSTEFGGESGARRVSTGAPPLNMVIQTLTTF
jgi:hypothetical protein